MQGILDLLRGVNESGATVVIVTHDADVAANAPRRVTLHDGVIEADENGAPRPVA